MYKYKIVKRSYIDGSAKFIIKEKDKYFHKSYPPAIKFISIAFFYIWGLMYLFETWKDRKCYDTLDEAKVNMYKLKAKSNSNILKEETIRI